MHYRVRYLLNFDLKIRSGQVWVSNAAVASSLMCGDKLTKREHTLHRLNKPIHDMIF